MYTKVLPELIWTYVSEPRASSFPTVTWTSVEKRTSARTSQSAANKQIDCYPLVNRAEKDGHSSREQCCCWNGRGINAREDNQSSGPCFHGLQSLFWTACYRVHWHRITVKSTVSKPIRWKKNNTGCGIVNTLNGLWKSKRCESASLVLHIRVRVCVAQLVICDALRQ